MKTTIYICTNEKNNYTGIRGQNRNEPFWDNKSLKRRQKFRRCDKLGKNSKNLPFIRFKRILKLFSLLFGSFKTTSYLYTLITPTMNISIHSIFNNQQSVIFSYSINGGEEVEETMIRDDFAKLLCEHSDGNYIFEDENITLKDHVQTSEDNFKNFYCNIKTFVYSMIAQETDYCEDCLTKYVQSLNKN